MKLQFITSGLRTTTQDLGRPGHTHMGVPIGGALDRSAMRYANHLVGNALAAPVLEVTLCRDRIYTALKPDELRLSEAVLICCLMVNRSLRCFQSR